MKILLAFAVGFALGGSGRIGDRDNVVDSFQVIRESEEVAAFMMVARSQVGRTLRQVADLVDGRGGVEPSSDLVDRVRELVKR